MAIFSSSTNFVSAASDCFGTASLDYVICVSTDKLSNGEEVTFVNECVRGKDGNWSCNSLNAKVMPPGIEDAIRKAMPQGLGLSPK